MDVEVFALCDAATGDSTGKLNLLGAFDTLYASRFPVIHLQCSIALRLRVDSIEQGQHRLRISVVDIDGRQIVPNIDGGFNAEFKEGRQSGCFNLVFNFHRLKFDKGGEYAVNLAIDGRHEKTLPLFVIKAEQKN